MRKSSRLTKCTARHVLSGGGGGVNAIELYSGKRLVVSVHGSLAGSIADGETVYFREDRN